MNAPWSLLANPTSGRRPAALRERDMAQRQLAPLTGGAKAPTKRSNPEVDVVALALSIAASATGGVTVGLLDVMGPKAWVEMKGWKKALLLFLLAAVFKAMEIAIKARYAVAKGKEKAAMGAAMLVVHDLSVASTALGAMHMAIHYVPLNRRKIVSIATTPDGAEKAPDEAKGEGLGALARGDLGRIRAMMGDDIRNAVDHLRDFNDQRPRGRALPLYESAAGGISESDLERELRALDLGEINLGEINLD